MARTTIDALLTTARRRLERLTPEQAAAASDVVLVDIRSDHQRARDGVVPGAIHHPRNVLEWRADPASDAADPALTDLDGGFQAWRAAGLPVEPG
jgi:rhodanese-related sulfurtransferase